MAMRYRSASFVRAGSPKQAIQLAGCATILAWLGRGCRDPRDSVKGQKHERLIIEFIKVNDAFEA
jgi:hypothetical protein